MHLHKILAAGVLVLGCSQAWSQTTTDGGMVSFGFPIASNELSDLRGGTNTVNEAQLEGTTANNTAHQVQTGTNAITDGAFANLSGLPIVIQNTGANVLIQNSVILNVQFK